MGRGIFIKQNNQWCSVKNIWTKHNGVWCPVKKVYTKVNGQWCLCFPPEVGYDVILAWNPSSLLTNCASVGQDIWGVGITPSTRIYKNGILENGTWFSLSVNGGWTIVFDALPDGRLLAVNDRYIYRETSRESNEFSIVAELGEITDPTYISVSPDKQKIALITGWRQWLLIFPVNILDEGSPPLLIDENGNTHPDVIKYDIDACYSVVWRDNQHIFVNCGLWGGPPYESTISVIDIINNKGHQVISNIPGASSGICFDRRGNFFCGIGYTDQDNSLIGVIHYFTNNQILNAMNNGVPLDFSEGHYLCTSLSAGHMLITPNNELVVGGGDYVNLNPDKLGYIEIFKLAYDTGGNISIINNQRLTLDPCQDDAAEGPLCLRREV